MTIETAQQELDKLIDENRNRSLWFARPGFKVDIRTSEADRVLEQIAAHASRSAWITARKLRKWRLQNLK